MAEIGLSTIWRWLDEDAIRPWQHRSWIAPRAADFGAKAAVVLDLYAGIYRGRALRSRDYVICGDEKTSIQTRRRCAPTTPPGPARAMRVEHEYDLRRTSPAPVAEPAPRPPPRPRLLVEPGRDLLSVVQRKVLKPNDSLTCTSSSTGS